jgi:hypothetical protein
MFSADLFANALSVTSRRFLERVFLAPEVDAVEIEGDRSRAEISFQTANGSRESAERFPHCWGRRMFR